MKIVSRITINKSEAKRISKILVDNLYHNDEVLVLKNEKPTGSLLTLVLDINRKDIKKMIHLSSLPNKDVYFFRKYLELYKLCDGVMIKIK